MRVNGDGGEGGDRPCDVREWSGIRSGLSETFLELRHLRSRNVLFRAEIPDDKQSELVERFTALAGVLKHLQHLRFALFADILL